MMQLEAEGTYMIRPSVDSSSKVTQRRHEHSGDMHSGLDIYLCTVHDCDVVLD